MEKRQTKTVDLKEFRDLREHIGRQSSRLRAEGALERERVREAFPHEACECGNRRRRHERLCDSCQRAGAESLGEVRCSENGLVAGWGRRQWTMFAAALLGTVCAGLAAWSLLASAGVVSVAW